MNELISQENSALTPSVSTSAMIFDTGSMNQLMAAAEIMMSGRATVPKHLRESKGDCFAVIMQSMQWEMNPFAVAQKTHLTQSGALGYEAQLINAVVISRAPIVERPRFEFIGDWAKILGRVKEMTGQSGGKYYVKNWSDSDESGLGVKCSCTLRGESEPREITVLLSQCFPRFSTQWATDPQQQITYAAIRKWARRYAPDVLLGVYTVDELDDGSNIPERDITPPKNEPQAPKELPAYSDAQLEENLPTWQSAINASKNTAQGIINKVSTKYTLSEAQKIRIEKLEAIEPEQPAVDPFVAEMESEEFGENR